MICPKCGSEVSGEVCVTCGSRVTGSSSFNLAGISAKDMDNINKYGTGPSDTGNSVNNTDDFSDMEEKPFVVNKASSTDYYSTGNANYVKKNGFNKLLAVIPSLVVILVVAAVLFVNLVLWRVDSGYKDVLDTFFTAMETGDGDAAIKCLDEDVLSEEDISAINTVFSALSVAVGLGMEIDISYTINEVDKLSKSERESYMGELNDDYLNKIHVAIVCDVSYTMSAEILGQSQSQSDTGSVILYKYDGNWYMYNSDISFN